MKRLIGVIQFLTRITLSKDLPFDPEFRKGIIYFPLVGLMLGLINLAVYWGLQLIFPYSIAVILTLTLYVILTGGLHLDGLGDTFDGFYSNRSRERILEIMRDSRLGTNGLLAIVLVLLLKASALITLGHSQVVYALVYMPVVGRLALVLGSFAVPYARPEGMGNIFIGKIYWGELLFCGFTALVMAILSFKTMVFMVLLFGLARLYQGHCQRKIGGMTGDTLGALCELSEAVYLLFLLLPF